jgi:hypothetical protein
MSIQASMWPTDPDEDEWKVYLRRDYPDYWRLSLAEAHNRLDYHERKRTHQTSDRDRLPRDLPEEWFHLMGEAVLSILLFRRGIEIDPLGWGQTSADARQRSREGNVLPDVSVYVPKIENGGLIIRKPEAEQTPDLAFTLLRLHRFGTNKEYLKAYGWRRAREGWNSGSNFGHRGTPLRDPGDRLVSYLRPMSDLMEVLT